MAEDEELSSNHPVAQPGAGSGAHGETSALASGAVDPATEGGEPTPVSFSLKPSQADNQVAKSYDFEPWESFPSGSDDPRSGSEAGRTAETVAVDPAVAMLASSRSEPSLRPHEAATTEGGRWGIIPAVFGVVLVLLLAAVGYLLFAERDRGPDPAVAELARRVASLEARPAPAMPDVSGLTTRLNNADRDLAAVKLTLAGLQERAEHGSQPASVPNDLQASVKTLDAKVADLDRGVTEVRTAVGNVPKPDFAPIDARVGDLDQHLATLQKTVGDLPHVDLAPVQARLETLEGRLKPVEAQLEAASTPARVAETRAAPLAVTSEAVRRAIDAGRPFQADFEALERLGADSKLLQPLQAVASNGAPTPADLRSELAGLRDRMLAGSEATPSGSYLSRIFAGASGLVQVRPLGSVVGDSPGAVLARLDADLGADDLTAALSEWQKLPDPAQTLAKGLADRIRLRLAAQTAARTIGSDAIQAMATAKE